MKNQSSTQKLRSTLFGTAILLSTALNCHVAVAQSAILAEMYGRGVHAHYAGNSQAAYDFFSMAINNGSKDPRVYYFRGLSAIAAGREYEAEADWVSGAELEAKQGTSPAIGQALARFQGPDRLKLEQLRQKAKLDALSQSLKRSENLYGDADRANAAVAGSEPVTPAPAAGASLPPTPPAADDANPFADDVDMAAGEAKVESRDSLGNVLDDVPTDTAAAPASGDAPTEATGDADIFDQDAAPAGDDASDPFADPFAE